MASVYHLLDDAINTEESIVTKYADHEYSSKRQFFAAVQIQKRYRGYVDRKIIKKWNDAATLIQKTVRGWLLRYHLPDIMHEYYDQLCSDYYNKNAAKIQAWWKGIAVRKEICIKDIIKEREAIMAANEEMQKNLKKSTDEFAGSSGGSDPSVMRRVMNMLFDRHHLLSIHQNEGILSNHDSRELSQLEKILKSMKWKDYIKQLRKYYNAYSQQEEEYEYLFEDEKLRKLEDLYIRQRDKSRDVRVDMDYTMIADLHQKPFNLNTKLDPKPYERLLTRTGEYTVPITKIVRTEEKCKNICDKDFDLNVLKKFAKEAGVPPYYIDFWYEKCKIHNFPE